MAKTIVDKEQVLSKDDLLVNNLLTDYVKRHYHIARKEKKKHNKYWNLFHQFYLGNQQFDDNNIYKIIFNNITPHIIRSIAELLHTPITIELISYSTSSNEINKTKELEDKINFYWTNVLKMQSVLRKLFLYTKIFGTSFLYPHIDYSESSFGKIKVTPLHPQTVFPDPLANNYDDLGYIIYAINLPLMTIKQSYPKRGFLVKPKVMLNTDTTSIFGQLFKFNFFNKIISHFINKDDEIIPAGNTNNTTISLPTDNIEQSTVLQMYFKDINTGEYPKGRQITISGDICLHDSANQYYSFPIIPIMNVDSLGFWGIGDVELLTGLQIGVNKTYSDFNRLANIIANPPIVQDENATDPATIAMPGALINKKVGKYFGWMVPPPLSGLPLDFANILILQMNNLTGTYETAKAQTATHVSLLEEAEQRRLSLFLMQFEEKLTLLVKHILYILTNYHTVTEQLAISTGKSNYTFRGIDFKDLLFDVQVKIASSLPKSQIIRNNIALQYYQLGLISKEMFFKIVDFPFKEEILAEIAQEKIQMQTSSIIQPEQSMQNLKEMPIE